MTFGNSLFDSDIADGVSQPKKTEFKLFDFFANCEYFETEFNYDQVLVLPRPQAGQGEKDGDGDAPSLVYGYEHLGTDILSSMTVETIGYEGMRIDRMLFDQFADTLRHNDTVSKAVEAGNWELVIDYVNREVFDKPEEYYTLDKLRQGHGSGPPADSS